MAAAAARQGADRRRRRGRCRGPLGDARRAAARRRRSGVRRSSPATPRSRPASSSSRRVRPARWRACWAPCASPTSRSAWRSAPTWSRRVTPTGISRRASRCATSTVSSVPGYGWMFPAGDGTVNIGVGALSTMKGFKRLNLSTRCSTATGHRSTNRGHVGAIPRTPAIVAAADELAPAPRAGMGRRRRRRRPDQPDERRRHRLRPRVGHARRRPVPRRPRLGTGRYDRRGRRPLRRVPADRSAVRVPDRSPGPAARRAADGGRHAGDRHASRCR